MAASFIKKNNGLFYLRLTGTTDLVTFNTAIDAGYSYNFYIYGSDSGTITVSSGGGGVGISYGFSGSGLREYQVRGFNGNGTEYLYNTQDNLMLLGGESPGWGGYAHPGPGFVQNPIAIGIKYNGTWENVGNAFIKNNGSWKEIQTVWVKNNGSWGKYFQNYGNSSWINMLEGTDDALDFAMQVTDIWSWPVSSFDGVQEYYPNSAYSSATSDIVTSPVTQSVTLYIEMSPASGSYSDLSLIRVSDGATIWSRINKTELYTETITFNVEANQSYYFNSIVYVLSYDINTSYTSIRNNSSSGTQVYYNYALTFSD